MSPWLSPGPPPAVHSFAAPQGTLVQSFSTLQKISSLNLLINEEQMRYSTVINNSRTHTRR